MSETLRRHFLAFVLAAALIVAALRGGSYGDVARGESFFVVWWVLGLGAAAGLLPNGRSSRSAKLAIGALVVLAGWTALGAIWSDSVERTLHEASRTLGLAGLLMLVVWTFGTGAWRGAAVAVTVAAVVVCCLALTSRLTPLSGALEDTGYVTKRLNYPFNYWNAVGVWAAMTVGLALAWSAHAVRWWLRAPALAGVCVAVPVGYLTYSRSAAAGVVIAAVTVVALSRHRWLAALNVLLAGVGSAAVIAAIRAKPEIAEGTGTAGAGAVVAVLAAVIVFCALATYAAWAGKVHRARLAPRGTRAVLAIAGLLALLAIITVGPGLVGSAWDSFRQTQEVTPTGDPARRLTDLSGERRNLWAAALGAFRRHPLGGEGAGTYSFVWNRDEHWSHHVLDAHSLYLEALAETGLAGALLLVLALGTAVLAALRAPLRTRDPTSVGAGAGCAAALIVFCATAGVDWMWESTAVAAAAVVCAGLALAAGSRPAGRTRALPRVAGVVLALVALGLQAPALIAASEVQASQEAVRDRRIDDAVSAATTAVQAEPWNASGFLQRALVLESTGFLDAAAADARRAIAHERVNAEIWLIRARIEAERGRVGAAIAAAERARALNPRNPLFAR